MPIQILLALASGLSPDTARRAADRPTIAAVRASAPIQLDGRLDEPAWAAAKPVGGFVQSEPREGEPATESTEVRVAYDGGTLYIGAYLKDREPGRLIVNDIKKDFKEEDQDDFEILLDTFDDRTNGYVFLTNPEGAKADRQVANEGREINTSWDAVWNVKTRVVDDGWIAEFAIPFRSLRFDPARDRWGINFSRRIRRKNEVTFWAPIPRAYNLARVSLAGELTGLALGSSGRNIRFKPYAAGRTTRPTGGTGFDREGDLGLDLKVGIGGGLTLDATVNPDFAQVEADEQQVNLTQFSQFFPEKREFFLENSGIFYVGDAARNNRVILVPTPDEDLLLFFSRRIGLTPTGQTIPIPAGVRLTGKANGLTLGALSMQTSSTATTRATNYGVFRLRKSVGTGSDIGLIAMNRQATDTSGDHNRVFGVDANIRFAGKVDWNSYLMGSETPGKSGDQYAIRTSLNYEGRFLHVKGGVLQIGRGFQDDLGFLRRTDARKYFVDIGIRPRPASFQRRGVREMHPHIVWDLYQPNAGGALIAKRLHTGYTFFFQNGAFAELSWNPELQDITRPFAISPSVAPIPAGRYDWTTWALFMSTDPSRAVSLSGRGIVGGLWSGRQRTINATVTLRPSYKFRLATSVQRTAADLDLPANAHFTAMVVTGRANYSFNTHMFLDALAQYDAERDLFNANIRFNLIHHPLSDLYLVFNEQRFTGPDNIDVRPGRSVVVKFTQMLAF
ncbi:MAG: carbohydrate binding family 9 domain-containing protein [Gemmatimonadetes bacterium]|nr:carbohydrate binding family 9 domain-containing protein [Gemmatimonadota bacterium]